MSPSGGGSVAPGFEPVAAEFRRNLGERGEVGAAFAASTTQGLLVDLWGGAADASTGRPWQRDTLQLVFSGSKGLLAAALLVLIDRGELDLVRSVGHYWPEFRANGKARVTVAEVVTHTARLPGIATRTLRLEDLADDVLMASLLAAEPQCCDPRAVRTYHPLTFGWLCGELIRRIDGRSAGTFVQDELAGPLGLDIHIGIARDARQRAATLELADTWGATPLFDGHGGDRDPLIRAVWSNPAVFARQSFPWNDELYQTAEIPGVNGMGTARDISKLYAMLPRLLSQRTLGAGTALREDRVDALLGIRQSFGVGFQLQTPARQFGPPADAYGHSGVGGSVHGAWPLLGVGFSYAMNLLRDDQGDVDARASALLGALHSCVLMHGVAPLPHDGASRSDCSRVAARARD